MKNAFLAVCKSIDKDLTCAGSNYHHVGEKVILTKHTYRSSGTTYYSNNKNGLTLSPSRNGDGLVMIPGFEDCTFKILRKLGFQKSNRSASLSCVEIDWSKCKRSIRNQARNIAKEHYTFGTLERIARGYKR